MNISYSDGRTIPNAVVVIWDDLHNERPGYFRAFWSDSPNGTAGSPVFGYCSPGGSYRTVKAVAADVRRYYPNEKIYRAGREIKS